MANFEKDNIPMLSEARKQSDELADSRSRSFDFRARTRSASMSISMDSYDGQNYVGYTGPLRSERKTPLVQVSGPLLAGHRTDNVFQPTQDMSVLDVPDPSAADSYPTSKKNDQNYWLGDIDNDGRENDHLMKSGQLGVCNDPYCTTCPSYYNFQEKQQRNPRASGIFDPKFHNILYGDAKGCARGFLSFLHSHIPGVMNPHAKIVQRWNKFIVICSLVSIFVDPLFFFLLIVQQDANCIAIDWSMTTMIVIFRSITDFIYFLHILLQFRLAYVAPESRVVGAGDLIAHPKKIAINYLTGYFFLDVFIVLPLPQIMILLVLPRYLGASGANYAKNLIRTAILIQYIPRLYRFMPLLAGQTPSGFIFESAWANFVINLLTFVLAGHVVGSCWYLFGLQRVNQCLRDACSESGIDMCSEFLDCGHGFDGHDSSQAHASWINYSNASACLGTDGPFAYGIYDQAVGLTAVNSMITRYVYSLFWGFLQISTLAGNLVPSYFVWEVIFTMGIIGLGLLLFALLIGNMQNFLQALGRRRLEMTLRRRDVEQWMSHRRLPENLRRDIREADRYNWSATRGVNEQELMYNLPEDLQRNIRRHLCKAVKNVRIFSLMDEPILDTICERLKQKTYIKGSKILERDGLVDKMVFIVRGKMESVGEDGIKVPLSEGDVCGEELLAWCLEHSALYKDARKVRILGQRLVSYRTVTCLSNAEVFTLRSVDIEEVTSIFARFLRNPRVQGAIRYESPYWRGIAARRIQVAWRYRQKRLHRVESEHPYYPTNPQNVYNSYLRYDT